MELDSRGEDLGLEIGSRSVDLDLELGWMPAWARGRVPAGAW